MDLEKLLADAIEETKKVPSGQIFKLKDLFEGYIWETIPRGDKLHLGRDFKDAVTLGKTVDVSYFGKAQNNSAQYLKGGKKI